MSRQRSVYGWTSAALIASGLVLVAALTIQSFSTQYLIEHRFWTDLLRTSSQDYAARVRAGQAASLPRGGMVRAWYVAPGDAVPGLPGFLATLPAGDYSTEDGYGSFRTHERFVGEPAFHARVSELAPGRLVTLVDIEPLEAQQNRNARIGIFWVGFLIVFIGGAIAWLQANLVRPVRDLAGRMQAMDPRDPGARLPTAYLREELKVIAQASNAHLERVEQFIDRERSLLAQASHEFRTPIAVIAGAADVLRQHGLPAAAEPALARIEHAVGDLSETMVALLYLAREPDAGQLPADVTVLHELLPRLAADHQHLLQGKDARLQVASLEPTFVAVPEAMVRIAVSNLLRNAIENTTSGCVELALAGGVVSVTDSGSGFDPEEAARRFRDSLRLAMPARGQGLGLFLIGRICDRFGWSLAIDPGEDDGTRARLDMRGSVIPLPPE